MTALTGDLDPRTGPLALAGSPGRDDRASRIRTRRHWGAWHTGLVLLAALASFSSLWALELGQRSEYYASIALSMSKNWSNFLFGAVDPTGVVSLDKIPGSYWVPALFVKVFGFSTWSVDAPNAIATVVTVVLVAVTAKRLLTPTAGLVAGAAVAATPILAAVARTNQPESFFVLALALAAWAASKALTRGSAGWLVGAGAFIALAFQMYMLEAWAVWPALAAAYLCVKKSWWRKVRDLAIAGVVSLALSLAWIILVWAVPAGSRPYVGGTYSNNPFEMVFGYNGLGRFSATATSDAYRSFTPPFSGDAGALRLFNAEVGPQGAWLIPAAVLAVVVLAVLRFSRPVLVFLGGWLFVFGAMFSAVAGMHQFYTASLALPLGLLVGLAFAQARKRGVLWPQLALILVAAATALGIGLYQPTYLYPVAVAQAVIAVVVCILLVWERRRARASNPGMPRGRLVRIVAGSAVPVLAGVALLLTPAAWSLDVMNHANSINPIAGSGSSLSAGFGGGGRPGAAASGFGTRDGGGAGASGRTGGQAAPGGATDAPRDGTRPAADGGASGGGAAGAIAGATDRTVLAYVEAHRDGARYLLATFGAQSAAGYITETDGDAVLPIGGFSGADPAPSFDAFTALVSSGELRYVLMSSTGGGFGGSGGAGAGAPGAGAGTSSPVLSTGDVAEIRDWVTSNCTPVETISELYSCAP
ncbi:ArnT family glycosyltransferase [Herbiconiux solani]|uniref:ArnT family glycosyltransferase n=1 Tax=Herbiconiux solani TaxID=661329 RepID=UPI0008261274|nr:glycosyltransferase family 39 protein [Herbiconiux solani]